MGFPDFKSYYSSLGSNKPTQYFDINNLNESFKLQADTLVTNYQAFTYSVPDAVKTRDRRAFLFSILPKAASPPGPISTLENLGGKTDWVACLYIRQQTIKNFLD